MTDPLRTYADLYTLALDCRRRLDGIRITLYSAAEALDKRPERFRFEGIEGVPMPRPPPEPFGTAGEWPTATEIQQALSEWHIVGERLLGAWEALRTRDRELLSKASPESAAIPRSSGFSIR